MIGIVIDEYNLSVLLIPHVIPLDGNNSNNDYVYMKKIIDSLPEYREKLKIMDAGLNSVETKYVIGQCSYYIGARTHSTIAALSNKVPTVSIAYSTKAKGLNRDLFGERPVVIDLENLNSKSLLESLNYLIQNQSDLRNILEEKIPELCGKIHSIVEKVHLELKL